MVYISICSFIILVSLIATLGKDRLRQQQRKLPASPPCSQAFVSETPGGSGGKDRLFISPARACRQQSMATLPRQALFVGTRCSVSFELSSSDAGSSPQPWGRAGCCSQGITPKAMESRVTAAWPGPTAMERLLLRWGCPSSRDAESIPCLHGKWAKPSLRAKLEFALSWFKKFPGANPSILLERGAGISVTLPSAGATHAGLVRQARTEVLMKL